MLYVFHLSVRFLSFGGSVERLVASKAVVINFSGFCSLPTKGKNPFGSGVGITKPPISVFRPFLSQLPYPMSEDQPPLGGGASPLSGPGTLAVADLAEKIAQKTGGQQRSNYLTAKSWRVLADQ
jgi:hypothetical protein